MTCCCRLAGPSADLGKIIRGATEAFDNPDAPRFSIQGPDVRMTSGP
jgi:hypothetical protein